MVARAHVANAFAMLFNVHFEAFANRILQAELLYEVHHLCSGIAVVSGFNEHCC